MDGQRFIIAFLVAYMIYVAVLMNTTYEINPYLCTLVILAPLFGFWWLYMRDREDPADYDRNEDDSRGENE